MIQVNFPSLVITSTPSFSHSAYILKSGEAAVKHIIAPVKRFLGMNYFCRMYFLPFHHSILYSYIEVLKDVSPLWRCAASFSYGSNRIILNQTKTGAMIRIIHTHIQRELRIKFRATLIQHLVLFLMHSFSTQILSNSPCYFTSNWNNVAYTRSEGAVKNMSKYCTVHNIVSYLNAPIIWIHLAPCCITQNPVRGVPGGFSECQGQGEQVPIFVTAPHKERGVNCPQGCCLNLRD